MNALGQSRNLNVNYRPHAATDSRRPRPNIPENGTFDIVTTECRRPDGCGACDKVAKNSASYTQTIHTKQKNIRKWKKYYVDSPGCYS